MKLSGYTTTRNSVYMGYPFEESIRLHLSFCDEVVVVDSSDTEVHLNDDTMKILNDMIEEFGKERLRVFHVNIDYDAPNHALWDGRLKGVARSKCTGDFLWQFDTDEAVTGGPEFRAKVDKLIQERFSENDNLMALPVIDFWGPDGHVRVDVPPWKWRLSRNHPNITHGVPVHLRKREEVDGVMYDFAMEGTDGCDYVWKDTGTIVPCMHFMTQEMLQAQRTALNGGDKTVYQEMVRAAEKGLPTVYHYSWYSVYHKLTQWVKFWNGFWKAMYNKSRHENPNWNPFFSNQRLEDASDAQLRTLASALETFCGGHIFHSQWQFTPTPWITLESDSKGPQEMVDWYDAKMEYNDLNDNY